MRDAVGCWRAELVEQVAGHLVGRQVATGEDRQQPAHEEHLAGGAEFDVAHGPLAVVLLAPLALEVDGDRAPVADQVVEQEPRRAVVARAADDVRLDESLQRRAVVLGARRGDRLQQQEHPPGEVLVRVVLEADPAGEALHVHGRPEGALRAGLGAVAAHDLVERVEIRRERVTLEIAVEGELPVGDDRVAVVRPTLLGGVDEQPVQVAHAGHLGPAPGAEKHEAGLGRQAHLAEVAAQVDEASLAAVAGFQERRKARRAAGGQLRQRARGRRERAVLHAREPVKGARAAVDRSLQRYFSA